MIDFSRWGEDELEPTGSVPAGWYLCEVSDAGDSEYAHGAVDIELTITAGPFKGSKLFDRLQDPDTGKDERAAKNIAQRWAMYLTRLGGVPKEKLKTLGQYDWTELVGRACVIHAKEDTYTNAEGQKVTKTKPEFAGVFNVGHEKIPLAVAEDLKKLAAKADARAAAAADTRPARRTPARNYDDL